MKNFYILLITMLTVSSLFAQLPTGLQTFQNATGSGTLTVTSVGGFFVLTATSNGIQVVVNADQFGAFVNTTSSDIITTYFEVKAAGSLGSFELSTATIGTYNSGSGTDHFTNVYVVGYLNNVIVAQTTPVNAVVGTWQVNFPINYTPFAGQLVDKFRVYYTKQADAYDFDFNFQDFTVANSVTISVATNAPASITTTGATLKGTINPNGTSTTVTFDYGTSTSYGTTVTADQSPVTGTTAVSVSKAITGLNPGTVYHYRVKGLSGGITTNGDDQVFTTVYTTPSTQATTILLPSNSAGTQLNVSWTNGNGSNRVLFMKQGAGVITNPTNDSTYTPSSNWSSVGSQLGTSGYYCIYNGTGNNVTVTNSTPEVLYTIQAFEYNGTPGSQQYYTVTASGNPSSGTALAVELVSFLAQVNYNSISLNWQTASEVNNLGFEVERYLDNSKLGQPGKNWQEVGFVNGSGNSNSYKDYSYKDNTVNSGKYVYRLKQIDKDGKFEYSTEVNAEISSPTEFVLSQNYPNPFNPSTVINYELPVNSFVTLKVYDLLGSEVATLVNESKPVGRYSLVFNGSSLKSGVYFYNLQAGNFTETKKFILMK
jgi:hypothetical protein